MKKQKINLEHLTSSKYRPDIDGLRAIAVLAVVFFHSFPDWFKSGFIGVDIFFVISGFLISRIILEGLDKNNFSFITFYVRRINRIFPSLLLVLFACFLLGWFVLLSDEYKQLGKHIAAGAGFIANFVFIDENSYFGNAAETKPLLHLWSLGIEEQFYIFWPLFLYLLYKLRLNLLLITFVIFFISFLLNISIINTDNIAAFYLPQTRFWELLAGSLIAYVSLNNSKISQKINLSPKLKFNEDSKYKKLLLNPKKLRNILSIFGLGFILISFFIINSDKYYPGWWALLPITGTVLIISSGAQAWLNKEVLSNRVLVWFGLISFPLYLWHWPLLVFTKILEVTDTPSFQTRISIILLAILLSWVTYHFIEKPIRFKNKRKVKSIILIILMFIIGLSGFIVFKFEGFGFRLKDRTNFSEFFENNPPDFNYAKRLNLSYHYNDKCNFYNIDKHLNNDPTNIPVEIDSTCYTVDKKNYSHSLFIWGDSHASHLYSGLKKNLPSSWQLLQISSSMCFPSIDVKNSSSTNYCTKSNWLSLETIKKVKPDVVMIATNAGHTIESFRKFSDYLEALGIKKIIFVGPTPHWDIALPKIVLRDLWPETPRRTFKGVHKETMTHNMKLQQHFFQKIRSDTIIYANIIDSMCNSEGCLTYIGEDKKTGITSFDWAHLTPIASDHIAKNILVKLIVDDVKYPAIIEGKAKIIPYERPLAEKPSTEKMDNFPHNEPVTTTIQIALSNPINLGEVNIYREQPGSLSTSPLMPGLWGIGIIVDDKIDISNNMPRKQDLNLLVKNKLTLLLPGSYSACPSYSVAITYKSLKKDAIYNSDQILTIEGNCK
jgi:peptidoglycan/LPS O-acetylase OafA/YrhL